MVSFSLNTPPCLSHSSPKDFLNWSKGFMFCIGQSFSDLGTISMPCGIESPHIIHAVVTLSLRPFAVYEYRGRTSRRLGGFSASHPPRFSVGSKKDSRNKRATPSLACCLAFTKISKAWLY